MFDHCVGEDYGEVVVGICVDLLVGLGAAVEFENAASLAVGYDELVHKAAF